MSVATVSRVLNDKGPASEATRTRIREVAERLRYVPHGAARSLITNRTNALGVLLPDIYGEFFSELIRGIDLASRQRGYHLLVSSSHGDRGEIEAVLRATQRARGRADRDVPRPRHRDAPGQPSRTRCRSCCSTAAATALASTRSRSTTTAAPSRSSGTWPSSGTGASRSSRARPATTTRASGCAATARRCARCRAAGRRSCELDGDFSEESGAAPASASRSRCGRPPAIFAANDSMAIGVLSALRERRPAACPRDISLAGFDDIPISRFTAPSLSSVRVPIAELGGRAVARLLHAIDMKNRHRRRQETLPTTLVVRRSCAAPGAAPQAARGTGRTLRNGPRSDGGRRGRRAADHRGDRENRTGDRVRPARCSVPGRGRATPRGAQADSILSLKGGRTCEEG